jgi:nucleotide-binding universal stress UspA family protein
MFKKILVPVDGSELAELVFPYLHSLAVKENAEINLVQVPPINFAYYPPDVVMDVAMIIESAQKGAESYLEQAANKLRKDGLNVKTVIRTGNIADEILAEAEASGADVIAMTTHGRSGVTRFVMGSIADKVLHDAKIPVFVVRP